MSDRTVVHVEVEEMEGKNKELRVAPQRNTHHCQQRQRAQTKHLNQSVTKR